MLASTSETSLVLNVSGHPPGRRAITRLLREAGFQVLEAATGAEALDCLAAAPRLDLAIVADDLPDFSGLEMCRRIKSQSATAATLVVQLSAAALDAAGPEAVLQAGADSYLVQPAEPLELLATVNALLRLRQAERRVRQAAREWSAAFAALPEAVAFLDAQGRVTRCNPSLARLVARPEAQVLGQALDELIPGLKAPPGGSPAAQVLSQPQPLTRDVRLGERWFQLSVDPLYDDAGAPNGAVCLLAEVTERKQTELAQALLAEAGTLLAGTLDVQVRMDRLANLVVPRLADWCTMHVVRDDGSIATAVVRYADPDKQPLAQSMIERYPNIRDWPRALPLALRTGRSALIADLSDEVLQANAHDAEQLALLRAAGTRSALVVPLTARGQTLGVLTLVAAESGRCYGKAELALAEELGRRAALALDNARLFTAERAARQAAELAASRVARLQSITAGLSSARLPAEVVELVVREGAAAAGSQAALLRLLTDDGQALAVSASMGYPESVLASYTRVSVSEAVPSAEAVRTGQPLWIESRAEYVARYPHLADTYAAQDLEALAVVPLMVDPGGPVAGVLTFGYRRARAFEPPERDFLLALGRQCALALERAGLYEAERLLRSHLEEHVQERTQALQSANRDLESEIVEHKRTEAALEQSREQLRSLSARLQAVREEERARLAREVHDELGGALTGLKMDLARLRKSVPAGDPDLAARFDALGQLIDGTVQIVRRIATELRPGLLDDFGLMAAIEWQLGEFEKRSGVKCALHAEVDAPDLDPDSATAVFRVFQETLTNVARHAQARRVDVTLEEDNGQLRLEVRDDGRGIQPDQVEGARSLGLMGMRERVHLLGGSLEIRGAPGHGTRLIVRVPLPRRTEDGRRTTEDGPLATNDE